MLVTATDYIPGKNYEILGMVRGDISYTKDADRNSMDDFGYTADGQIKSCFAMFSEARSLAEERMAQEARALGANAIIGARFMDDTAQQGTIEVIACGTAVRM